MRLTTEEHPEAVKRYAHMAPARGWRARSCAMRLAGSSRVCSREPGHRGLHVAHGLFTKVVAVWDADTGARASEGVPRRSEGPGPPRELRKRTPLGLRTRPAGILELLRECLVRVVASAEELVFLVLFFAFVGFAVYWFRLILG